MPINQTKSRLRIWYAILAGMKKQSGAIWSGRVKTDDIQRRNSSQLD